MNSKGKALSEAGGKKVSTKHGSFTHTVTKGKHWYASDKNKSPLWSGGGEKTETQAHKRAEDFK